MSTELSHEFVLTFFLEPLSAGTRFLNRNWPLHVTLISPFSLHGSPNDLVAALKRDLATMPAPIVTIGDDALFGPTNDVPVSLVRMTEPLRQLHEQLFATLATLNASFRNPQHVSQGYHPHVTVQGAQRVRKDDKLVIDVVSLVDMAPDSNRDERLVIASMSLTCLVQHVHFG